MKIFYKTRATATGGRSGHTGLDDGSLGFDFTKVKISVFIIDSYPLIKVWASFYFNFNKSLLVALSW